MSLQHSRAGLQPATKSHTLNSTLEGDKSLKPAPAISQSFARISADISELTLNLTPCARRLYDWLLQQKRSGVPQEVFLEEFAETTAHRRRGSYSIAHIKRALKELLDSELVGLVLRYSAKIFKLVAHDSRTFSSRFETEMSKSVTKKSKIEPSNPYPAVGLNREDQRKNTDQNLAAVQIDREVGPIVQNFPELEAADYPELMEEVEATLQQPLSTNFQQLILQFTISRVRDALDSFRESKKQSSPIRNPEAWFRAALKRAYKPNRAGTGAKRQHDAAAKPSRRQPPPGFAEWFELAKRAKVASASSYVKGEFCIHTPTGWETWAEMQMVWPLERLQSDFANLPVKQTVEDPTAPMPQPTAEELADPVKRSEILARLKGRFKLDSLRDEAIQLAELWGFAVSSTGIAEGAGCG